MLPVPSRLRPPEEVAACQLAYAEGWAAGQRTRTAAGARSVHRESTSRIPVVRALHVHVAPRAANPLVVHLERPEDFEVDVLQEQGGWTRIRHEWTSSSSLDGWVRTEVLRAPPVRDVGLGNLGTIGHGGGRGGQSTGVVGTVDSGTPVFASRDATQPWATVRGSQSVRMMIHEHRAELIEVDGVEVESPGAMWVPLASVHPGVSAHHGLTLVEVPRDESTSIRVDWVEPGSRADDVGLRVGDVIVRVGDRPLSELRGYRVQDIRHLLNSTASFSVRRRGQRVDLRDECRARHDDANDECLRNGQFTNCPRPPPPCCPI